MKRVFETAECGAVRNSILVMSPAFKMALFIRQRSLVN